jgi:hypothetical protein
MFFPDLNGAGDSFDGSERMIIDAGRYTMGASNGSIHSSRSSIDAGDRTDAFSSAPTTSVQRHSSCRRSNIFFCSNLAFFSGPCPRGGK